ncbi:MAG: hypothetical protein JW864_18045 [Spirochaetes bacterium]|nr:hypothetical protein [Spirochaetota bacterium]
MKKILSLLFILALLFSISCSNSSGGSNEAVDNVNENDGTGEDGSEDDLDEAEIIYGTESLSVFNASDIQMNDAFGVSVSISGDYAIAGANKEDGGYGAPYTDAGAAYIFEKEDDVWSEKTILYASDICTGDGFGISTSISSDYAIIGAYLKDVEDEDSGSTIIDAGGAYIYERDTDGNWTEKAVLTASDAGQGDYFGISVSISGDYAIVGAYKEDGGADDPENYAGAAYIFERGTDGTWTEKAILHASDYDDGYYFGISVSISNDYSVVGSYGADGGGAAYIYERDSEGTWTEATILTSSDLESSDRFGEVVSINGNYVLIGAVNEDGGDDTNATDSGSAYIFERNSEGLWEETAILHASDMYAGDSFGCSVSIDGDLAVIGAYGEDGGDGNPVSSAGAVYVFSRDDDGVWNEDRIIHSEIISKYAHFGKSVAVSGDYLISGAYTEDCDEVLNAGRAYIY